MGALLVPFGLEVPMFAAAGLAAINFFAALATLKEPTHHELRTDTGISLAMAG